MAALADALESYAVIDEPYRLLEEDGFEFSHPPSLEDFETQLERSLDEVQASEVDTLFDRCPADLLAYLVAHPDADGSERRTWWLMVEEAMNTIELVVFVPLVDADDSLDRALVDETLADLLQTMSVSVIVVRGDVDARIGQVLDSLAIR